MFTRDVYRSGTLSFKLLRCLWFSAACFILMNIYKSSITSAFSSSKLMPRIQTLDQLLEDTALEVGTFENSYPHTFVKASSVNFVLTTSTTQRLMPCAWAHWSKFVNVTLPIKLE